MYFRPKSFKYALNHANQTTAQFQLIIEKHKKVLKVIRSALPEALEKKAQDCFVKDSKLLIYTESAAWASQLRFYSQAIRSAVNANCNETIDNIQLKVLDAIVDSSSSSLSLVIPSQLTIDTIVKNQREAADSELKNSLLNLAQTLKKLSHT